MSIKRNSVCCVILFSLLACTGCCLSQEKGLLSFSFPSLSVTGTVDEVAHTATVAVPFGTDVRALIPTVTISSDASLSPASGLAQDFSSPLTYTVTAQDGTTQDYMVTVGSLWKDYLWSVKSGIHGPGRFDQGNYWDPKNVFVDSSGYLHLKISHVGDTWYCAELSTTSALEFGTYQWQVEGRIDTLDPQVVLGFFTYGGVDGINEIDIEYMRKGSAVGSNSWWTVYPATKDIQPTDHSFSFTLTEGNLTTSRFTWSSTDVNYWLIGGHYQIGSTPNAIESWTTPQGTSIPQVAMPLHMNLWLYQAQAPTDGQEVEVIIRDFQRQ